MKKLLFVLPILVLATIFLAWCSNDSQYIQCTEEQKNAEICTMDYTPVCGDDGMTYSNACSACASQNIDWYKMGECEEEICDPEEEICDTPELE